MNFARRRKLRETRRARRQAALTADEAGNGAAMQQPGPVSQVGGAAPAMADGGTAANASNLPGRHRRAALGDAARLAEKIRRRKEARTRADRALSEREAMVQQRYAPYVGRLLRPEDTTATGNASAGTAPSSQTPSRPTPRVGATPPHPGLGPEAAITDFDKEDVLATLITEAKANFMAIDRTLSEDHTIATRHLHSAVFSHANNFLLLFRDVDRASGLVETLKSSVQGTKTAISSISKFTYANVAHLGRTGAMSSGERDGALVTAGRRYSGQLGGEAVFGFTAVNGDASRPRPSLITRRLYSSSELRGTAHDAPSSSSPTAPPPESSSSPSLLSGRNAGPRMEYAERLRRTSRDGHAVGLTTRGLNVASVRQWRYWMGLRRYSVLPYALRRQNVSARAMAATSVEAEASELQRFVDVLREEVNQLLAERKPLQAAELLHGVAADATAKGCLPTLLELEAMVVYAVVESLHHVPMTPMYAESVHVPLLQLLLRFGRERSAAAAYLNLQAPWLHRELRKLQTRVSPAHAGTVAVDFLVRAMRFMLYRQHTLWLPLRDAEARARRQAASHRDDLYAPDMLLPTAALTAPPPTDTTEASAAVRASSEVAVPPGGGPIAPQLIPPNSGALLWVRRNVAEFTQTVLATHMLSYGTGTDGGDPSRIRRAATLMAETIRLLRTMTQDGFAGCDTSTLRQLTPTLMLLESDFAQLTARRLHSSGRAMLEQLMSSVRYMYETHGAAYDATVCADVARQGNAQCQLLLRQTVQCLPDNAHTWLLQLLLAPASARRAPLASPAAAALESDVPAAPRPSSQTATASGTAAAAGLVEGAVGASSHAFVSPALYRFFRYANGGTPLLVLLLRSMTGFVAAMAGSERLPAELVAGGRGGQSGGSAVASPLSHADPGRASGQAPRAVGEFGAVQEGGDPRIHDAQAALRARVECATLLLGNALVTESVDLTLHRLVQTFVRHTRAQREALVRFARSDAILGLHRQAFVVTKGAQQREATTRPPLLADAARSPCWVLDSLIPLLTDVLTLAVWVSYLAEGGALGQMLANPAIEFRTQYVESWRRAMPTWVQDWLTTTLVLGFDVIAGAAALLPPPSSRQSMSVAAHDGGKSRGQPATRDTATAAEPTSPRADRRRCGPGFTAVAVCLPTATTEPRAGSPAADAVTGDATRGHKDDSREGSNALAADAGGDGPLVDYAAREVGGRALGSFLAAVLERAYKTPRRYRVHRYIGEAPGPAPAATVFVVRAAISRYPRFPVGRRFDHQDELFLFHWVAQIALHLLTLLQERLLTASFVVNGRANETTPSATSRATGLDGCTTPREDSVFALLCAGGGSYVTAIALLQFAVLRLLRDALCQTTTWCAVYRCGVEEWRASAEMLRQQLFFFALYMQFWSPLFAADPMAHGEAAPGGAAAGASCVTSGQTASSTRKYRDGDAAKASAKSVLQWLTCSEEGNEARWHGARYCKERGQDTTSYRRPATSTHNTSQDPSLDPENASSTRSDTHRYPTMLRCVVQAFFEDTLGETRAMKAIDSELMHNRVSRAMKSINLLDFVDAALDSSDDTSISSSDDEEAEQAATPHGDATPAHEQSTITLHSLQTVLHYYLQPL